MLLLPRQIDRVHLKVDIDRESNEAMCVIGGSADEFGKTRLPSYSSG